MTVVDAIGPEGFGAYKLGWDEAGPTLTRIQRAADGYLLPGFVDLHIHGAFGIDFMDSECESLVDLARALELVGYEAFYPTTVTARAEEVLRAAERLPEDVAIPGFHLEGPFLSPYHPGSQPEANIIDPPESESAWDAVLDHPRLKRVTLAPERPRALELTLRMRNRGVDVSMGHTNATFEEARRGFEFGAGFVTHMFNAMRPFHHRDPGVVAYALTNPALGCELIYDRRHVSQEAAGLLLRSKPREMVYAVSDGTMLTGMPPQTSHKMWGLEVASERGYVRLADNDTLAGSAITLADAFRYLAEDFDVETAIRLCCLNPRIAAGMDGPPRVWLLLDRDLKLVDRRTFA